MGMDLKIVKEKNASTKMYKLIYIHMRFYIKKNSKKTYIHETKIEKFYTFHHLIFNYTI